MHRSLVALSTAVLAVGTLTAAGTAPAAGAGPDTWTGAGDTVSVRLDPRHQAGGEIPSHFVGLSVEWSLIERYMGAAARPAFSNLLANLDTGVLRIGGSSQDLMQFDPAAANTNRVITPEDIAAIRSTLDATRGPGHKGWKTVLGTAMAPVAASRPFVSPEHTRTFIEQGVEPAFAGARDEVAGVELGNEPDLTYRFDLPAYLADFERWKTAGAASPFTTIVPATSNAIASWQNIESQSVETRFFWDWPEILDTTAETAKASKGPLGAWAADHFYPLARTCASDPYRCPTIPTLLSRVRAQDLDYIAYRHAREAAARGLGYRLEEINTAAGRGAEGVSNVAASAVWALDAMFRVACPTPPDQPSANADCRTGAVGVNFHNAERNAFFKPEEGNGFYNAIDFDPGPAMGAPAPRPVYYAMLLFARFAQGGHGLRPVAVDGGTDDGLRAWSVEGRPGEGKRLFLVNKGDHPVTVHVRGPAQTYELDRMTPHDPDGAGRVLDAPDVRIDGRQVGADGVWPGFSPTRVKARHGELTVELGTGEAVVASGRP